MMEYHRLRFALFGNTYQGSKSASIQQMIASIRRGITGTGPHDSRLITRAKLCWRQFHVRQLFQEKVNETRNAVNDVRKDRQLMQ